MCMTSMMYLIFTFCFYITIWRKLIFSVCFEWILRRARTWHIKGKTNKSSQTWEQSSIKYHLTNEIREQIDEYSEPFRVKLKSNKLMAAVSTASSHVNRAPTEDEDCFTITNNWHSSHTGKCAITKIACLEF